MPHRLAGLSAFLGHLYPVWLGFKGGKGVATFIGTLLALAWPVGLAVCGTWLVAAADHPLFLFRCHSVRPASSSFWMLGFGQGRMFFLGVDPDHVWSTCAIRQHHAPARRDRTEDRARSKQANMRNISLYRPSFLIFLFIQKLQE